jgi:iron complex outermembrane recepter protein
MYVIKFHNLTLFNKRASIGYWTTLPKIHQWFFILALTATFCVFNTGYAQKRITGRVIDEQTQQPIYGAKITTNVSAISPTSSDFEGKFTLQNVSSSAVLLKIEAIGFESKQVNWKGEDFLEIRLSGFQLFEEVIVAGRRRKEVAQDIPIPMTVISGQTAEDAGAFNVNRLKELVPSVQLYSSNARNTTLNIRGLGSTFGLTNDGIDPGVGFYIDGVYHARPAATALDFIDVDQMEILRGPQGTLFGKNTTAGAFNITSKKPSSEPSARVELSYGNYNFMQAKASVSGPINKVLSTRISFSGTQRDGTVFNTFDQQRYNGLNNIGVKGQLRFNPNEKLDVIFIGDYNNQRPDGSSLVVAGVTQTLRSPHRQYENIVNDLGYNLPTVDPFSRKIETNTPYRHDQSIGGLSLNVDYKVGKGTITSTSAWRFWNWDPVNDRDFTRIAALTKSQAPSRHDQFSQEIRYAGEITKNLTGVVGLYYLNQMLESSPYHEEEVGPDQWRFVQTSNTGNQALYSTPGLLDNYGIRTYSKLNSTSAAAFSQLDWKIFKVFHIIGGLRFNYDEKTIDYKRETYGGLQTTDPVLLSLQKSVYSNQEFNTSTQNTNLSGNVTLSYQPTNKFNTFATFSTAYKPVGVNVGGLPTLSNGEADLSLAVIKPEYVTHFEFGIKSKPIRGLILNFTAYNTDIQDYQTIVQSPQLGVNRGYLSNAEKVNVKGLEVDASYMIGSYLSIFSALAYTDGKYLSFKNAPLPLELTGQTIVDENGNTVQQAFIDASGGQLPGVSKWNTSGGFELSTKGKLMNEIGRYFMAFDATYRSRYSSNPTPSSVLNIDDYALLNTRFGFRSGKFSSFLWVRNLTGTNYFEQLQAAAGNAGLYAGVLGDPRTYGITLRYNF